MDRALWNFGAVVRRIPGRLPSIACENRTQVLAGIIVPEIRDAMPDAGNKKLPVDVDTVIEEEKTHIRPKSRELGKHIHGLKQSPGVLEEAKTEVVGGSALCLSGGG